MRIEDAVLKYGSVLDPVGEPRHQTVDQNLGLPKQSFGDVLKQKLEANELTFSKHAQQRLAQRDMELSEEDLQKMNAAARKAEAKGADNTLVLSEKGAFIINVSNHVVITAMSRNDLKENIFTQIDSAVVI